MRVLTDISPAYGRGALAQSTAPIRAVLPRRGQRLWLTVVGFIGGAALLAGYAWLMVRNAPWQWLALYAAAGGAFGLALALLPRLLWHFLTKQWRHILLRQFDDRSAQLAEAARRRLDAPEGQRSPLAINDLGVVSFLQRDCHQAVDLFAEAEADGVTEATGNLLVALSETAQWGRLRELLAAHQDDGLLEAGNLARVAALTPDMDLIEALWAAAEREPSVELLNNLAVRALRLRNLERAREALRLALDQAAMCPAAMANQGLLAQRQGDLNAGLRATASAAALAPEPATHGNLGALLAEAGRRHEALGWLTRAERLEPRNAAVQINLGNVHAADGRQDEAFEAYRTAISLGAFQAIANCNLALLFVARKELDRALNCLKQAESQAPHDEQVLGNLGCLHFEQGHYEQALECFQRAQATAGGAGYSLHELRALIGAGHIAEARRMLDRLDDDDDRMLFERGVLQVLEAAALPGDTETHRQMRNFQLRQAAQVFHILLADPHGPVGEATFNLGLIEYAQQQYLAAAETLAAALKTHPHMVEMNYVIGRCYVLAATHEQDQRPAVEAGVSAVAREFFAKARPYLNRAFDLPGFHESAAYNLGLLHYAMGSYREAADVLRKLARPDSPPHILNAAALALARYAQALQASAQTASLMPDARKRQVRDEARGLLTAAVQYFRLALHHEPEMPLHHANLGLALMLRNDQGDVEAALHHWQLMHRYGDVRLRRAFQQAMEAGSPEEVSKLQFQDVELIFLPIQLKHWIMLIPPRMAGPRYVLQEVVDLPEWHLQAHDSLIKRSLSYRRRALTQRELLQHLVV